MIYEDCNFHMIDCISEPHKGELEYAHIACDLCGFVKRKLKSWQLFPKRTKFLQS